MQGLRYIIVTCGILCISAVSQIILAQGTIDTRIAVNSQTDDKTFVVIIANENYRKEECVPYALNDGTVFKLYCQKTLGIPESNIRMIQDATLNEMTYELDWLDDVLHAYEGDARAIIYYTGHGMPDEQSKEAYLLPVDGYSQRTSSALSVKQLYAKLGQMQTNSILVFLDACFSGTKRDGKMLASSRGVAIKAKELTVGANTVVFTAAQGDETAYPYNGMNHGLFTYYLLNKMQQSGGYTTMGELSDYVTREVKRKSIVVNGKSQTPSVLAAFGNQEWRNWRLASVAAKQYETHSIASTLQTATSAHTAPATASTATTTSTNYTIAKSTQTAPPVPPTNYTTPKLDNAALNSLVEQGKKDVRAMKYENARRNFAQAANQGSIEAYYQLGLLYSNNNYDGFSRESATKYFQYAANAGHLEASYQTGMMYLGSDNVTAKQWFRQAANKGHQRAQVQLSKLR